MRTVITLGMSIVFSAAASLATAQSDQDHAAHHPEAASAPMVKKAGASAKAPAARSKPASAAASGAMDGADMKRKHDEMHKPGGMHDQMHDKTHDKMHEQMHGKDGKMMGAMPGASAASK